VDHQHVYSISPILCHKALPPILFQHEIGLCGTDDVVGNMRHYSAEDILVKIFCCLRERIHDWSLEEVCKYPNVCTVIRTRALHKCWKSNLNESLTHNASLMLHFTHKLILWVTKWTLSAEFQLQIAFDIILTIFNNEYHKKRSSNFSSFY